MRRNGPALVLALLVLIAAGVAYSLHVVRTQRANFAEKQRRDMTAAVTSLRASLREYRQQHGRYPTSLEELRSVPVDPITGKKDWAVTTEESVQPSADFTSGKTEGGKPVIVDVRSSATGVDATGKAWSSY